MTGICSNCGKFVRVWGSLSKELCLRCDDFISKANYLESIMKDLAKLKVNTMKDSELFKAIDLLEIVRKDIDPREKETNECNS